MALLTCRCWVSHTHTHAQTQMTPLPPKKKQKQKQEQAIVIAYRITDVIQIIQEEKQSNPKELEQRLRLAPLSQYFWRGLCVFFLWVISPPVCASADIHRMERKGTYNLLNATCLVSWQEVFFFFFCSLHRPPWALFWRTTTFLQDNRSHTLKKQTLSQPGLVIAECLWDTLFPVRILPCVNTFFLNHFIIRVSLCAMPTIQIPLN